MEDCILTRKRPLSDELPSMCHLPVDLFSISRQLRLEDYFPEVLHWAPHANVTLACALGSPHAFCGQASGQVAKVGSCVGLVPL